MLGYDVPKIRQVMFGNYKKSLYRTLRVGGSEVRLLKLKEPALQYRLFLLLLGGEEKSLTKLTLSLTSKNCWTQPLRHPHDYATLFMSLF